MGKVVDDLRRRWDAHRKHADDERAAYKAPVSASKELYAKYISSDDQKFPPNVKGTRVITFDFAQSIALLYHTDQAGPSYFKVVTLNKTTDDRYSILYLRTLLKVALFGLEDEEPFFPNGRRKHDRAEWNGSSRPRLCAFHGGSLPITQS